LNYVCFIYIYIYIYSTTSKRYVEILRNWNIPFQLKKQNTYQNEIDNLAFIKHLTSLLFLFFSFCFSCVSLTSAAVIEKRSLCCFYFIKSSVASCSQCCFCKAEERVAADEKDSPLLLPVQRGWKALKADKANLLLLLAHGTEKMTLLEGGASTTGVRRSWVTLLLLHDLLILLLEGSCWTTTSHGGTSGCWWRMSSTVAPELLTLLVQRGSLLLVVLPIAKGMCWSWAAAWRCSWCRAGNWTEITVLSRLWRSSWCWCS